MLLALFLATATAGERSEDCLAMVDTRLVDGVKTRTIHVLGQHETYVPSEWTGVRSAAVTGVSALDSWYAGLNDAGRSSWWAALPAGTKAKYRNAILDLAP